MAIRSEKLITNPKAFITVSHLDHLYFLQFFQ